MSGGGRNRQCGLENHVFSGENFTGNTNKTGHYSRLWNVVQCRSGSTGERHIPSKPEANILFPRRTLLIVNIMGMSNVQQYYHH